jgi:uncharacterized repeat protein (TIGR01451 family)
VVFTSTLVAGSTATVDVEVSQACLLSAWCDFDGDGDWDDAGEQIFSDEPLVAGVNPLTFAVSSAAIAGIDTFARFRVSSSGGLSYTGEAADGEVEDHLVTMGALDFGDAPDPFYPTRLASDGARHVLGGALFLGAGVDAEVDGQPTAAASGDDESDSDDEDGVVFPSSLGVGLDAAVEVTASADGLLNAWIDFNADGDWLDPGEQVFADEPVLAGTKTLTLSVPATAAVGTTCARFRVDSVGGLSPTGLATDGEVEDLQVVILIGADLAVTMSGAPDPAPAGRPLTYTVTVTNNGPMDATSVRLIDPLPPELTFVSSSAPCAFVGDALSCPLGSLEVTESIQVSLEVLVDYPVHGSVTNTVTVDATETDPIAGNDTAAEITTIGLFIEGFEGGDLSAWAGVVGP